MSSSHGMEKSWDGPETPIQAVNLPLLLYPFPFSGLFPPPCGIAAGDGDQGTADNKDTPDLRGSRIEMLDKEVSVSQLQQNKHHGAKGFGSPQDADPGRKKELVSSACPWLSGLEPGQQHKEQIPFHSDLEICRVRTLDSFRSF